MKDLDVVRVIRNIKTDNFFIPRETIGTIVHRHQDQKTVEVEFSDVYKTVQTLVYGKDVLCENIDFVHKRSSSRSEMDARFEVWLSRDDVNHYRPTLIKMWCLIDVDALEKWSLIEVEDYLNEIFRDYDSLYRNLLINFFERVVSVFFSSWS